jgi:CheY-like chemotaxis protein
MGPVRNPGNAVRPEILCIGRDPVLNRTRRMVLHRCFVVAIAASRAEAVAQLAARSFDLVLLCYSLSDEDCQSLLKDVQTAQPNAKILALSSGHMRLTLALPHEEFASEGPEDLLRKIAAMTGLSPRQLEDCDAAPQAVKF